MLINEQTWAYVRQHQNDDVRKLALQGGRDAAVDLPLALQLIAGWQTSRHKLPTWAATEGLLYPPHLNMEQCSSEQTAQYKTRLAGGGVSMVDLTGGFGVDFYWIAQGFQQRTYVERNKELADIAASNFRLLGLQCQVCCQDCVSYLADMKPVTLICLDPARRNQQGVRTYSIADCTPNVLELLPQLLQKCEKLLLKLSPMLDWRKAVHDLGTVHEVHIVSVNNECKELLLLLGREPASQLLLCCVNNDNVFQVSYPADEQPVDQRPAGSIKIDVELSKTDAEVTGMMNFLYEPNASVMKAGCFRALRHRFPVQQLGPNSHLFLAATELADFPGRGFLIESVSSMNKKELRTKLESLSQANISVRNFPLTAEQLRKKLKLKDGGDVYIFATTVPNSLHKVFICRKIR